MVPKVFAAPPVGEMQFGSLKNVFEKATRCCGLLGSTEILVSPWYPSTPLEGATLVPTEALSAWRSNNELTGYWRSESASVPSGTVTKPLVVMLRSDCHSRLAHSIGGGIMIMF